MKLSELLVYRSIENDDCSRTGSLIIVWLFHKILIRLEFLKSVPRMNNGNSELNRFFFL